MTKRTLIPILAALLMAIFLTGSVTAQTKSGKAPVNAADLIDINSATKDQLMTLPGIGDALSQKIIAGRPYRAKNVLIQKKIIPQSTYDKISGMIIARQSAAPAAKKPAIR